MPKAIWNLENVTVEASKYGRRCDFVKGSPGAYTWAHKNKVLNLCCSHMEGLAYQSHNLETVQAIALKYNTRRQLENNDNGAYQAAQRNNWLDVVCGHMEAAYQSHTLKSVKIAALKYDTRKRFLDGDKKAYEAALRNNWLDIVCDHMERDVGGYDTSKPGTLYYIRLDLTNSAPLYKIGITNMKVKQRIKTMQLYPGTTATILQTIWHTDGACIARLEKYLHNKFKLFQYDGPRIMDNGNTELFTVDVSLSGPFEQYLRP